MHQLKMFLAVAATLLMLGLFSLPAVGATFVAKSAELAPGEQITSNTSKNANRTRFIFVNVTINPRTKISSAFVQWAPLLPKAGDYKNGTLVDKDAPISLWINGIWYTVAFDGTSVTIK